MQSRKGSLAESIANVVVGYWVATISQIIIFGYYDVHFSLKTNMIIGVWFTLISVIRSFTLRRVFNAITTYFWRKKNGSYGK